MNSGSVFFMDLEIKKLREQWEYLQGGFLFLQESGAANAENALALADGELRYYIDSLTVVDQNAEALKEELGLSAAVPFDEVPSSLALMTDQDIGIAKDEGEAVDATYGSVALVLFYGYVRDYLKVPSVCPGKMRAYVLEKFSSALPGTDVVF